MFNQRKSFFKGKLFYIVLLALFAFGIWLNQAPSEQNDSNGVKAGTEYPASTDGALKEGDGENYDIMENIIESGSKVAPDSGEAAGNDEADGNHDAAGETEIHGYYLVKEVDGLIKIFYYDESGKESLVRVTDIAFSLLSVADQALFQKGVIKHTAEELDELLQDFES